MTKAFKRTLAIILSVIMLVSCCPVVNASNNSVVSQWPVADDLTFTLEDSQATYQWYETVSTRGAEITSENASAAQDNGCGVGTYVEGSGWQTTINDFFTISLQANESIYVVLYGDYTGGVGLWDYDTYGVDSVYVNSTGASSYTLTVDADGDYTFYTYPLNATEFYVRAYFVNVNYVALDGETSSTLQEPVVGKEYFCVATLSDGSTVRSNTVECEYSITHQPTADEPYVKVNDDTNATYQWYKAEDNKVFITPENATAANNGYGSGKYVEGRGWMTTNRDFFTASLKAGDTVTVELYGDYSTALTFWDYNNRTAGGSWTLTTGASSYTLTVDEDGEYTFYTFPQNVNTFYVKAYFGEAVYTAIEGETSALLEPEADGTYACMVTFADGSTKMSDTVELKAVTDGTKYDFLSSLEELFKAIISFIKSLFTVTVIK